MPSPSTASSPSALDGLPAGPSALTGAQQLGARAAAVGFDWSHIDDVFAKVREEVDELGAAIEAGHQGPIGEELGDLLFALCNLARHADLDAEACGREANDKFARRFRAVEGSVRADATTMAACGADELEARWARVKRSERGT